MYRLRTEPGLARALRALAVAVTLGIVVAGCSNLYYDRRDTIALGAGDAVAANAVEQMVDPWPRYSGDVNVPFDGQRMQAAVERYRLNKVTPAADSQAQSNASAQSQNVTQVNVGGATSQTGAASSTSTTPTSTTPTQASSQ